MSEGTCPDCHRPIALSYEAWQAHRGEEGVYLSCAAHTNLDDEDMWGDESIPDCRWATILWTRAQLSAATARASELERELALLKGRRFPVHSGGMTVPWQALVPHEPQALANHGQTLERLASRGGLGWSEMLAVLEGKGLRAVRETTDEAAKPRVLALVTQRDTELAAMGAVVMAARKLVTKAVGDDGLTHTDELSGADLDELQAALGKLEKNQ